MREPASLAGVPLLCMSCRKASYEILMPPLSAMFSASVSEPSMFLPSTCSTQAASW